MNAKLCATVTGATTEELRAQRDAVADVDMVEVRLDYARELDVAGVLAGRRCPIIVTCRPMWEGGQFQGSEEERREVLTRAYRLGADYVDVEWRAGFDEIIRAENGRRIVLSAHDFKHVPRDLDEQFREMRATGAEVVKVAVQAETLTDLVTLRDFGHRHRVEGAGAKIVIGMGPAGITSRVLPDRFGSCWTYAGQGIAAGQLEVPQMLDEFRVRTLTADAELFGVVGSPLSHSLSPVMHNAGFHEIQRDAVYLPFEAADVDDFERFAVAFGVRGASVTAPYKESILSKVVSTDALSQRIGAVNTIRMDSGGWLGINTDVPGFLAPLDGRIRLDGCRVTVLGAGGAARGVTTALFDEGAAVTVCARSPERALAVARLVEGQTASMPPQPGTWDLLVNTTPIGTYPNDDVSPMVDIGFGGGLVYDLVYNPTVTRLLTDAAAGGCSTIGGLDMLVAQAERQFFWWTGLSPEAHTFRCAAQRRLRAARQFEASRAEAS
jgi:3-dehydroquinate dehydratase/shikimate dehydrogenase